MTTEYDVRANSEIYCSQKGEEMKLIAVIDSDGNFRPYGQVTEAKVKAAVRKLYFSEDQSWDEVDWPMDVAQWLGVRIDLSLDDLADFYGVDPPAGSHGVQVSVYRLRAGEWRIRAFDPGWDLRDVEWAPSSDQQAAALAEYVRN